MKAKENGNLPANSFLWSSIFRERVKKKNKNRLEFGMKSRASLSSKFFFKTSMYLVLAESGS